MASALAAPIPLLDPGKDGKNAMTMDEIVKDQPEMLDETGKDQVEDAFNFERFENMTEEETKAMNKRIVRKIDTRLLPILVLLFILNILDRGNLGQAKIAGMTTDLHLVGVDYNNIILVQYMGYIFTQFPAGFIMGKYKPALLISICCVVWGVIAGASGAAKNVGEMMAVRFLVGVAEAPFFPGAIFILSSFYNRRELGVRIAVMYSGNSLSSGFGGLLSAAVIAGMNGVRGISGWRWLFIIEGLITVACGLAVLPFLVSSPASTRWMNEEERRFAAWRMTADAAGQDDEGGTQSMKEGIKLVMKDWKILILILQQLLIVCSSSFGFFFPAIVGSLGYPTTQTLLLTAPPYFVALGVSIAVAWSSGKYNERAFHIAIPMLVTCVGNVLVIALPLNNIGGRYFGMYCMTLGFFCAFNLAYAWVAATIPRPKVKRAAAIAIINGSANIGNLFTSYVFRDQDAPRYVPGGIALTMFCLGTCMCATALKFILKRENRKMDRCDAQDEPYTGSLEAIPKGYRYLT